MDQNNRPRSREKNVVGGSSGVQKRGSGLGTGPVGNHGGRASSGSSGSYGSGSGNRGYRSGRNNGRFSKRTLVSLAVILIFYFAYSYFTGGNGGSGSIDSGYTSGGSSSQSSGSWTSSEGNLNTAVSAQAREKYTTIQGGGKDVVTIMVYLCGTDLESKSGMATADMKEMLNATLSDKVNLILFTGGCKQWNNNIVSSEKNQIYQIKNGELICLEDNMGKDSMTKPETLTKFIQYCTKNFPADRNDLIFWDHGGGSLSGYGYDEKNSGSGSMSLAGINKALDAAGITYDFIGFDACLMATLENALMLTKYADYLIASEETEPGVGWYYTNWLTALAKDTSRPTVEIGKDIVDDFIDVCAQKCSGQKTTLSVVDLAELQETVPDKLTDFASATKDLIQNDEYQKVSNARYAAREFAQSSKIDQIDLVHLAQNLNNAQGKALSQAILGAVKYNRTSPNMTNANGISIYFPYKKVGKVDTAVAQYKQIGMDSEYARCIQEFASMEVGGQSAAQNNLGSFSGSLSDSLLNSVLSGFGNELGSLDLSSLQFLMGRSQSDREIQYYRDYGFDASLLRWTKDPDGMKIKLPEDQWSLIQEVELNVYFDDGEGYIDLGLDNLFSFDKAGNLLGDFDNTWLSINGQIVAYYHTDTVEEGSHYAISGYVPVMLNGSRAELILVFDDARPDGYIAGAKYVYTDGETDTVAKNMEEVKSGDRLEFLCDYYSYSGRYQDSYYLGDPMTLGDKVVIGNADIGKGKVQATYRFTDIYHQYYWTPVLNFDEK